jgi:hypothetical protein
MKKLILMTSALTLVGGVAFAGSHSGDFTVTGEAFATQGNWDDSSVDLRFGFEVVFAAERTAGGLTTNAELTVADTGNSEGTISEGTISIAGGFGKFAFASDEWDTDSDDDGDMQYTGSFGGADVSATVDSADQSYLLTLGVMLGGADVGLEYDSTGAAEIAVDVASGGSLGAIGAGGSYQTSGSTWDVYVETDFSGMTARATYDSASVAGIELSGSQGGTDWSASTNTTGATAAEIATTFGDTKVSALWDSTIASGTGGGDAQWWLRIEHAVDMVTLHAQVNEAGESEVGATLGFAL